MSKWPLYTAICSTDTKTGIKNYRIGGKRLEVFFFHLSPTQSQRSNFQFVSLLKAQKTENTRKSLHIALQNNTPLKKLRIGENPSMHRTVRKHENHGAIDVVVLYHPLSSSTVFTAASFNSVVVEPHFKCGYTIKESSLLLLTYYYTSTVCCWCVPWYCSQETECM